MLRGALVFIFSFIFTLPSFANAPQGGITFEKTRVVYTERDRGGTALAIINNTPQVYLIYARVVLPSNDPSVVSSDMAPFTALPPVSRLEGNSTRQLRVIRTGGELPVDRESLFYLSLRIIPSSGKYSATSDRMGLGVDWNMKVFYRPEGLEGGVKNALKTLSFERKGDRQLKIHNSSPFWLTFSKLTSSRFGEMNSENLMVPPAGDKTISLPENAYWQKEKERIYFQLIDENGKGIPESGGHVIL